MIEEREIDVVLAEEIVEKVGVNGEAWLVFDMDGTLAHLAGQEIIRPTLGKFFKKILENNITIYFGIYSNNHSADNVDSVANKIGVLVGNNRLFNMSFKLHNFHKFRGEIESVKIGNGLIEIWDRDKTYDTIEYAYKHSGNPITDPSHVYFFDDRDHYSVGKTIGDNYIHVTEYKSSKKRGRNNTKKQSSMKKKTINEKRYRKTHRRNRR